MNWSHVDWKDAFRRKKELNTFRITLEPDGNLSYYSPLILVNGSKEVVDLAGGETYFFLHQVSPIYLGLVFSTSYASVVWPGTTTPYRLPPGVVVPVRIDDSWPKKFFVRWEESSFLVYVTFRVNKK